MHRSNLRSLAAAAVLLTVAAAHPAGAQDQMRLASPGAAQKVHFIDFSDWLAAQTTQLVIWQAKDGPQANLPLSNTGVVDYAGKLAAFYHLPLGTSVTGTVKVTALPDGTGEVLVNVDFTNALTYAVNSGGTLIFGYTGPEVVGGRTAALSSGHVQVNYIVPDADNPPLNLIPVIFSSAATVEQIKFHSDGDGALRAGFGVPEGTPGTCIVAQNGLFNTGGGGATADGFPVEHVDVHVAGGADLDAVNASPTGSNAPASIRRHAVMNSGLKAGDAVGTTGSAVSGSWGQLKARYRDQKASR